MGEGDASQKKFTAGMAILPSPNTDGYLDSRQDCSMRSYKKTTKHVCIFYFSSVKYPLYIYFRNKYQFGGFVH